MPHASDGPARKVVAIVLAVAIGPAPDLDRRAEPIQAVHARPDQQNDPCPTGSPPGTVLWMFQPPQTTPVERITNIPAVANDGTVVLTAASGRLFALDCMGKQLWMRDRVDNGLGSQFGSFTGPPAIGDDGTIYTSGGIGPSAFLAVNPNGSLRRIFTADPPWIFSEAPAVDRRGRVFATAELDARQPGGVFAFTPWGSQVTGFPLSAQSIGASPVVLADGRAVVVSHILIERAFPTAPPPTLPPPPTRSPPPPTPWGDAVAAIHLPLLRTFQPVTPRADEPPGRSPRPTPIVVTHPALLYILSPDTPSSLASTVDFGLREPVSSMVPLGHRLVLQVNDGVLRLIAMAIDSDPPRVLWEHVMLSHVAVTPLLGRSDADSGTVELIYLDVAGTLVSLAVPGAQDSTTAPRFNWAQTLPDRAAVAPVLGDAGLVYAAAGSTVAAFSRVDGSEVWSIDLFGEDTVTTSLTMGPGGVLYFGTQRGLLMAISTESGGLDPDAAWPAVRHDARNTGRADR